MSVDKCFCCRFFIPDGMLFSQLRGVPPKDCLDGECHRHGPELGVVLVDPDGDEFRHYGEWPKVMADDWCGEFVTRQCPDDGPQTAHVGPRSNISCGAGQGCQGGKCQSG